MDVFKKLLGGAQDKPKKPDYDPKKPTRELWQNKEWSDVGDKIKNIISGGRNG
jgi:hypothetical protein